MEPLLGTLGLLPVCFHLGLKLYNTILGRQQLMRKPLCRIDRMPAVLLGNFSSFVQKLQDRLTGLVELSVVVSLTLSRSLKRNHFWAHYSYLSLSHFKNIASGRHLNMTSCG